jgi:hypothetical protein
MNRTLALVALLLAPLAVRAQPDADADKPYDLQVVLRTGAHNWLGKTFRDDLRTNVAGMLTDALSSMANVSVVDLKETPRDQWQPLWTEFEAKGFAALDTPQELTGIKTHFLTVDFVGGQYELQSRQFDGQTGAVSPWRHERTPDRAFVARLAGKMIAEDFGIIGTLIGKGAGASEGEANVAVKFKAAGTGSQIERWVKPGDVFAVYVAFPARAGGKPRAIREIDSIVRVTDEPKNGAADGKLFYRAKDSPLGKASATAVLRCIKLGAAAGPMRLRLVKDDGQPHTGTLQVRVHSQGFQKGDPGDEEILNPDRGGLFVSRKNYDHIAFARVVTGANQIARIPVPIQEGREIVCTVGLNAQKEEEGRLQAVHVELKRLYDESLLVYLDGRGEVAKLVKAAQNQPALERARKVARTLDDDINRLAERKESVKKEAGGNIDVSDCDGVAKELEQQKERLNRLIGQLDETVRLENAPDKVERRARVELAKSRFKALLESDEFDAALTVLDNILKDYPDENSVKKQRDELAAKWELKGNEHAQARQFVYEEWAKLKTVTDIESKLPTARLKFQVLQNVHDQLTVLKLRNSFPQLQKIIRDEAAALAQSEDADKKMKLQKLAEAFDKFQQEVDAASSAKSGG